MDPSPAPSDAALTVPAGVGWTALVVAAQRAAESRRPDALFHDPLAEALAAALGRTDADGAVTPSAMDRVMGDFLPVRTCFFDRVIAEHPTPQVVVLAAGLDGRGFRLRLPEGTRLYEVDVPDVTTFRETVAADLTPTVERRPVVADLREDWPTALVGAGFDPARPTTWLLEGLLIYLPADAADVLLDRLTALSAPGSAVAVEYADSDPAAAVAATADADDPDLHRFAGLVASGPSDEPGAWLGARGWTVTVSDTAEQAGIVGRPAPAPMDPAAGGMTSWLAVGRR